MEDVYRITIWRPTRDGRRKKIVKYGGKVRVAAQLRTSRSLDANGLTVRRRDGMEDIVAIERMTGTFNEVSALFDCGPDNGNGTWLADAGPDPVRKKTDDRESSN